jgi:hypothetical protein
MSTEELNSAMDNELDSGVASEQRERGAELDNDDLQITVSKIEFPVKPRGVLAE